MIFDAGGGPKVKIGQQKGQVFSILFDTFPKNSFIPVSRNFQRIKFALRATIPII